MNNVFLTKKPYSQQQHRYSNAAAANNGGIQAVRLNTNPQEDPLITLVASPLSFGTVKFGTVERPTSGTTQGTLKVTQKQYDSFSNASATGTGPVSQRFPMGTNVWISAAPVSKAYRFVRWSDGNTSVNRKVTVTADVTYTAIFEVVQSTDVYYTVAVQCSPTNGGNVNAPGLNNGSASVKKGDKIKLTATAKSGYKFVAWKGIAPGAYNLNLENPILNLPVERNWAIVAVFEPVNNGSNNNDNPNDQRNPIPGASGQTPKPEDIPSNGGGSVSGGGGGGGSYTPTEEIEVAAGASVQTPENESFEQVVAFVKKWWWALLIAYVVYKNSKGGKQ